MSTDRDLGYDIYDVIPQDEALADVADVDNGSYDAAGADSAIGGGIVDLINSGQAVYGDDSLIVGTPFIPDLSNESVSHDLVFSASDYNTVAWASGTITTSGGISYSISAGNTGNMSARTIIYLDTAISVTVLQVTTTPSSAVGSGKCIIAVAEDGPAGDMATFQVTSGIGGLAVNTEQMFVDNLAAINADMGAITAGTITLNSAGYIRGGQTAYDTGTGFFLGYSGSAYKFSIGIGGSTNNSMTWDGTNLTVNGYTQTGIGTFGGDGSDGALSISSGTTTLDAAGACVIVKNYTSISITGTAKLTISNKHANGTILILKSKGSVTITASAPCIDMSGMGADGGGTSSSGSNGFSLPYNLTAPTGGRGGGPSAGGAGGTAPYPSFDTTYSLYVKSLLLECGAGGGGGETFANSTGGAAGGGVLILECGGALNFTTASGITVAGATATTATVSGASGGGGGGGMAIVLYRTLTSASGTIVVTGGNGGGANGSNDGGGGGASISTNGSAGGTGNGAGGAGGAGVSLIAENKYFA